MDVRVVSYLSQQMMNALASRPSVLRQSSSVLLLFELSMVMLWMEREKKKEVQHPSRERRDAVSVPHHKLRCEKRDGVPVLIETGG